MKRFIFGYPLIFIRMNNESDFDEKPGDTTRRDFLKNALLAAGAAAVFPFSFEAQTKMMNKYGLFGKLQAKKGQGAKLAEFLMKDADKLKGCLLYVVSRDAADADALYVMEVWETKEDHDNSLKEPFVRELIKQAMPIIAETPTGGTTLEILGGKGV